MPQPAQKYIRFRLLGLLAVLALFLSLSAWNEPLPFTVKAQTTPTPQPVVLEAEPSPTPTPTLVYNPEQTNGIVFGGTMLILIVVISSLVVIRARMQVIKAQSRPAGPDKP